MDKPLNDFDKLLIKQGLSPKQMEIAQELKKFAAFVVCSEDEKETLLDGGKFGNHLEWQDYLRREAHEFATYAHNISIIMET